MTLPLSIDQMLDLNRLGLVPGPGETAGAFQKRANYCLTLKEHLAEELKSALNGNESNDPTLFTHVNSRLAALYDLAPTWIPLFFSNYRLPFWHGGCAWIFQIKEESPTGALIQLRRSFKLNLKYLGIYQRDELLVHELVHVGRMAFQEPRFEEILAYQTSPSFFRRTFGPLVQSSTESVIFILVLFLIIVFDFFLIASHRTDAYAIAMWLKLLPLGLVGLALIRLWKRQRQFRNCLNKLAGCVKNKEKATAVVYRLRDQEISLFSNISEKEIKEYASAQNELRWEVIRGAYFE